MRVGVEVGGTFTDLVVIRNGGIEIAKVPSTPQQPDVGALQAIEAARIGLNDISDLVHGSTVATNAVLERKGGRVGMFVTAGTRDLFGLQRQDRTAIYDLKYRKPEPVVARMTFARLTNGWRPMAPLSRRLMRRRWRSRSKPSWPTDRSMRSPSACCTAMPIQAMSA